MKHVVYATFAISALLWGLSGAWAATCPSYTVTIPFQTSAQVAGSGTLKDSGGNTWNYTTPAVPSSTSFAVPVTITPATCALPPPISTDGTTSTAPSGAALTTAVDTWSWSSTKLGSNYSLLRNGTNPASYAGTLMEVAHGGQFYAQTSDGRWYVFNGTTFVGTGAP